MRLTLQCVVLIGENGETYLTVRRADRNADV